MNNTRRLAFVALFSSLLGILSQISLPLPGGIPLTLQTFAVALCGCVLGPGKGTLSVLIWLLMGSVGLPFFSGFQSGFSVLFGPSGGFLMGFLFLALFCGVGASKGLVPYWGIASVGLLLCHLCGVAWFSFVTKQGFLLGGMTASFPYFLKDMLSLGAAWGCSKAVGRSFPGLR